MNDRILTIRKKIGCTQADFAKELGLTKNYISLIETGKRAPASSTIKTICKTYNVNEDWLLTGEGEMFVDTSEEEELAYIMGVALNDEAAPARRKLFRLIMNLPSETIESLAKSIEETFTDKE